MMAALLEVGGDAAVARHSAARCHGLELPRGVQPGLHLLVATRTFLTLPDVTVHRTRNLDARDVVDVGAFTVTGPTRTVIDLAADLDPWSLRRLVAQAARRSLITPTEVRATARRLGRVRGKRHLLALVDELSPLDADCASELETRFLRLMRGAGLEPSAMNHPTRDVNGRPRWIDAVYLPEGLPIELDSQLAHGSQLDRNDDEAREQAIRATGDWLPFVRFTWEDVIGRPTAVVERVRRALEAASPPVRQRPTESR